MKLSVEQYLSSRLDVYPKWFYYDDELQEQKLSALLDNVLVECFSSLCFARKIKKGPCSRSVISLREAMSLPWTSASVDDLTRRLEKLNRTDVKT